MEPQPAKPAIISYANTRSHARYGKIRQSRPLFSWIGLIGWSIAAGMIIGGGTYAVGVLGVGPFMPYTPIALVLGTVVLFQAIRATRKRRARDILIYLEQAIRLNLPIPPMLWAAEENEPKATAARLHKLRVLLEDGGALSQSLTRSVPEIPASTIRMIDAAERLGELPFVLAKIARPTVQPRWPADEREAFYQAYPPAMLLILSGVGGIMSIFVMDKFRFIFRDFKLPMPPVTRLFLSLSDDYYLQPIMLLVGLIWLGQVLSRSLGTGDRSYFGHLLDRVYWYVPIVHRRIHDGGISDLCRLVASATAASWPLDQALDQASQIQTSAVLKKRITHWADGIRAGQSISESARDAQMPRLLVSMLAPIRNNQDLSQALLFLADHYQTRFNRTEIMLKAAYIPAVVILLGICVGFVAMSLFMPLVDLIKVGDFYTRLR